MSTSNEVHLYQTFTVNTDILSTRDLQFLDRIVNNLHMSGFMKVLTEICQPRVTFYPKHTPQNEYYLNNVEEFNDKICI